MNRLTILLAILVALPVHTTVAQWVQLERGARVRALLDNPTSVPWGVANKVEGTVVRSVADTLVLEVEGQPQPIALPRAWVASLEFVEYYPGALMAGAPVRVTTATGIHSGTLMRLGSDTLIVGATPIARERVTRLELRRGRKSGASAGATVGGVLFGFGGLIVGLAGTKSCDGQEVFVPCNLGVGGIVETTLGFASMGVGVGALLGLAVRSDRWVEIPLHHLRLGVAPQVRRGRPALAASVRF